MLCVGIMRFSISPSTIPKERSCYNALICPYDDLEERTDGDGTFIVEE